MPSFIRNPKDFFTGIILLATAAFFVYGILELEIGSAFRMGPGYFPMLLTGMLGLLALGILINGLRSDGEPIGALPWRGLILITFSIVLFGLTLRGLGLVPSLVLTVLLSTFASDDWDARTSIGATVVLVLACVGIFVKGLGLPLSLFGPWVGGY